MGVKLFLSPLVYLMSAPSLIVSTDLEALKARALEIGSSCHLLLLDSKPFADIPSSISVVKPTPLAGAARLSLLDEYVEAISKIGKANEFSNVWLSHPISEKNDLEPNPLFQQILELLEFRRQWDRNQPGHTLAVLCPRKSLLANIVRFAEGENIAIETPGLNRKQATLSRRIKQWTNQVRAELSHARRLKAYQRRTVDFRGTIDASMRYTLIRTWFDSRSREEIEAGRDVFLGPLPGYLQRKGRNLLYYGGLTDIDRQFERTEPELREIRAAPVAPEVAFLRAIDRWRIGILSLTLRKRIRLPSEVLIGGFDVSMALHQYLTKRYTLAAFRKNTMSLLTLRRLLRCVGIEEIYMPFENNSWQKLLTRTVREHDPSIPIKAFQHAQIAQSSTRLFLGTDEAAELPLPDYVYTLGAYTRDYLVRSKRYPESRTLAACALRQDGLPSPDPGRPRTRRLLACLWTMRRSIDLVDFLTGATAELEGWDVTIRPHPVQPIDRVRQRLRHPIAPEFEISDRSFGEDLQRCDVVLYNGTTACLDALACGRPVINLEFEDFISPDPLFEFDAFKWTIRTGAELRAALDAIVNLSDSEYESGRTHAERFVSEYFYPTDERTLDLIVQG